MMDCAITDILYYIVIHLYMQCICCIVHCNKVSNDYRYISPTNLNYCNHVFNYFLTVVTHLILKNKNFEKYFKKVV